MRPLPYLTTLLLFCVLIGNAQDDPVTAIKAHFDKKLRPFYHGVASGDPLNDRVMLWTRAHSESQKDVTVKWSISTNPNPWIAPAASGTALATSKTDFTVKVDATGLRPGTKYYYQFEANGLKSIIGQTKTTPETTDRPVRLAFVSCSNYETGYFNAYRVLAERGDLDAVIHLGDYIYEYGTGTYSNDNLDRKHIPSHEAVTLQDYRLRYSLYRTDKDLLAAHAMHPFITTWDDHELANNAYSEGAQNHQQEEGTWQSRSAAARQAYYEWLPIREDATKKHYRSIAYGNVAQLLLLDTRLEDRSKQVKNEESKDYYNAKRTIIGDAQFDWLKDRLADKTYRWNLIANQVPLSKLIVHWKKEPRLYMDGWDGYPVEKKKLLKTIKKQAAGRTIIMTGDYHSSLALETDFKGTSKADDNVAVEFIVPSISSSNVDERETPEDVVKFEAFYPSNNPHLKYVNLRDHGYVELMITAERIAASYVYTKSLEEPSREHFVGKAFIVTHGKPELESK